MSSVTTDLNRLLDIASRYTGALDVTCLLYTSDAADE